MTNATLTANLERLKKQCPDRIWLRDRKGDEYTEWSWSDAYAEVNAAAAWLEGRYGASQANIALLSRNRAHWMLADLAIIASGNVTIPLFTTLATSTASYTFSPAGTSSFGVTVVLAEDIDNDGHVDVIVGDPGHAAGVGRFFVFH